MAEKHKVHADIIAHRRSRPSRGSRVPGISFHFLLFGQRCLVMHLRLWDGYVQGGNEKIEHDRASGLWVSTIRYDTYEFDLQVNIINYPLLTCRHKSQF